MAQSISITILGWEKYNHRSDIKNPSWFRMQHNLFTNWQFYDFTHVELCVWIYFLCEASHRNEGGKLTVNYERAHRVARFDVTAINSTIKKLKENQVIEVRTLRGRYADVEETGSTRQDKTEQDRTRQDKTEQRAPVGHVNDTPAPPRLSHPLVEIWNSYSGSLSKVETLSKGRKQKADARWSEKPEYDHWKKVVAKINQSPFCIGQNDRGWKATFDFLIKPDTSAKVLEGTYDDRSGSGFKNGVPLLPSGKTADEIAYEAEYARLKADAEEDARRRGIL